MPFLWRRENGVFYFVVTQEGRKYPVSLRTKDRKLARERYAEKADQYDRGLLDLSRKTPVPTFQNLFDEYLPFCKKHLKPRTYSSTEGHIRRYLAPFFGGMRASDLTPKHIETFVGGMLSAEPPFAVRTINLHLETLRKILRRAVGNRDMGLREMPCKIKLLPEPDSLPRYAEPDHIRDWMGYLDAGPRLRAILSLMTGITDRDLGFVRKDGYDRSGAMLRFRRPKTETDIVIPLTPIGVKVLEAVIETGPPGPMLFEHKSGRKAFLIASKKLQAAGGKNLTPHMLRHSFASWLLSISVDLSVIQKILGHKDIKTTMRYARMMPESLRAAVKKIEAPAFDIAALLSLPKKGEGRHGGMRWTEEQRAAQAEKMRGNKLNWKTGKSTGRYAKYTAPKKACIKKASPAGDGHS